MTDSLAAFNSWWLSSKYMQVVNSPPEARQIARDGWQAALSAPAGCVVVPSAYDWLEANGAVANKEWQDGWDACRNRVMTLTAAPKPSEPAAPPVAVDGVPSDDELPGMWSRADLAGGETDAVPLKDRWLAANHPDDIAAIADEIDFMIRDHARIVAEHAEIERMQRERLAAWDAEVEAWRRKLEPLLAERWKYKQRAEALEGLLREACGWNWLDDDLPPQELRERIDALFPEVRHG